MHNIDYGSLERQDLLKILSILDRCMSLKTEDEYHCLILEAAEYLHFKYVLYAYTKRSYFKGVSINLINLSNPKEWMDKYQNDNYITHDPVRIELEKRLKENRNTSYILWDAYDRTLSAEEQDVINVRSSYGLKYGFSVYDDSSDKDFTFLLSLSDSATKPDERTRVFFSLIMSHLTSTRKRLDMITLVSSLSKKERGVCTWLMDGKTNWETSQILGISENTVKYHIKNIYSKLGVVNRQQAMAVLMAEKYLHL